MRKNIFEEIRLIPTLFYLDIWINWKNRKELSNAYSIRYGLDYETTYNDITESECSTIESGTKSPLKGEKRIVLVISDFNVSTLVHEIVHIFYHLNKYCKLGNDNSNQEWIAYFQEYVYDEIMIKVK